jgi:hypothetical protein
VCVICLKGAWRGLYAWPRTNSNLSKQCQFTASTHSPRPLFHKLYKRQAYLLGFSISHPKLHPALAIISNIRQSLHIDQLSLLFERFQLFERIVSSKLKVFLPEPQIAWLFYTKGVKEKSITLYARAIPTNPAHRAEDILTQYLLYSEPTLSCSFLAPSRITSLRYNQYVRLGHSTVLHLLWLHSNRESTQTYLRLLQRCGPGNSKMGGILRAFRMPQPRPLSFSLMKTRKLSRRA